MVRLQDGRVLSFAQIAELQGKEKDDIFAELSRVERIKIKEYELEAANQRIVEQNQRLEAANQRLQEKEASLQALNTQIKSQIPQVIPRYESKVGK